MKNKKLTALTGILILMTVTAGCGKLNANMPAAKSTSAPGSSLSSSGSASAQSKTPMPASVSESEPEIYEIEEFETAEAYAVMDCAAEDALMYTQAKLSSSGLAAEPGYTEPDWNTEEYSYEEENPFRSVKSAPFSTFAADVDTASYANVRRMILDGDTVIPDAVRAEEMINYFHYDYAEPDAGEPFGVTTELAPCPWNTDAKLLLIGLQAQKPDTEKMPDSNLVFLIDVSGSMSDANKLPLVKRSFMTLTENLSENDRITLITYADGEAILCEGVPGTKKAEIMSLLESLEAGGATDGQHALEMAYEAAEENYIEGGNNRIILATDGDFNVGITSEGDLTRYIKEKTAGGICLSVLGYGMGNYKDNKMESIADNGNGNYYYIDDIAEARKVLVEEAGGTLFTVAKDVKLQVEFNPAMVKGYRLIGYENRTMAAEAFSDDTKDGGEIGAGHQITALYEILPIDSDYPLPEPDSRYSTYRDPADDAESSDANSAGETAATNADSEVDEAAPDTDPSVDTAASDSENEKAAPPGSTQDEWLTVNIRYKEPDGAASKLLEYPVNGSSVRDEMSDNMSWAAGVAQTAMLLKDSAYAGDSSHEAVKDRLKKIADDDYREEFLYLLTRLSR